MKLLYNGTYLTVFILAILNTGWLQVKSDKFL